MKSTAAAVFAIALSACQPVGAEAQNMPRAIQCVDIKGSSMSAPNWQAEIDGTTGQTLRIEFGGEGKPATVQWKRNGEPFGEMTGLAMGMKSGFVVLVVRDDFLETYTYNAGSAEMLFTQTRSGGQLLPNGMKMFRGRCTLG